MLFKINTFSFYFLFIIILTMMNNSLFDNSALRFITYTFEIVFIIYIYNKSNPVIRFCPSFWILSVFLLLSFISSYKTANYVNLLKYIGYVAVFFYGKKCSSSDRLLINRYTLFSLVAIPLLLVLLFDHTPKRVLFFPNSNNFTYWGICVSLFYYVVSIKDNKRFIRSLLILGSYLTVGTSLGILVALICAVMIINRKNLRLILFAILLFIVMILLIFNTDIPLFLRLKNQILVITSLSLYDWIHLGDLNMYEVQMNLNLSELSRDDNTSALWRFQHWAVIITEFLHHWYYSFIIGLGDGYSNDVLSGPPHNDFLRVFAEYGLVVFFIIIKWMKKLFKFVSHDRSFYIVLTIFIYHLTENLVETFPASCFFYFSLGYLYYYKSRKLQKTKNV